MKRILIVIVFLAFGTGGIITSLGCDKINKTTDKIINEFSGKRAVQQSQKTKAKIRRINNQLKNKRGY